MTVEKLAYWIPITDEMIVDGGFGTSEERKAAAARIEARQRAIRASWYARPWWDRVRIVGKRRLADYRARIAHARRALRGIDCEWDD